MTADDKQMYQLSCRHAPAQDCTAAGTYDTTQRYTASAIHVQYSISHN